MRGIYCITNTENKKIYIGQSQNLIRRRQEHYRKLRLGTHENSYLQNAFNKYGENAFKYEVLYLDNDISDDELNHLEFMLIHLFGSHHHTQGLGYNLTLGGNTRRGFKHKPETLKKMSESRRGEKNSFYGKSHSPESIEKIKSNSNCSHMKTPEYREKMSRAMTGRIFSDEHRQNKSNAQIGGKNPQARKVSVNGIKYDCIKDVADFYGIRHNTASYRLNSKSDKFNDWFYLN